MEGQHAHRSPPRNRVSGRFARGWIRSAQAAALIRRLPAIIAAAGAILLVAQWSQGRMLWLDEEMIAINIRERSLGELMGALSLGQAAPFGWLAIERAILRLAGDGARALRFLPLAFGVATLGVAVWIGRRWMRTPGAATLAFLCAAGQWLSFHALELKHYSADACFGLLLPALAVWALEPPASAPGAIDRRRIVAWWSVAIAAQWIANGAIFAAPACAVIMLAIAGRRAGWRGIAAVAAPGVAWVLVFAVNYAVSLAPIRASDFLQSYWRDAFPPPGAGVAATLRWLAARMEPLAVKPGGSGLGLAFWAAAVFGWLVAPAYPIAFRLAFALVPASGFVWAGVRLVPMFERLSLWMVPAVYVGIAMMADAAADLLAGAQARRSAVRAAAGIAATGFLIALGSDVFRRGLTYLELTPYQANHETDDRSGVRWLARAQQPGDVWLTSHNALPAIWWYADDADPAPIFEADWLSGADDCGGDEIGDRLRAAGASRVLVYLGFGHATPQEFDDVLVGRLAGLGQISGYRRFGGDSHGIVVDLRQPSTGSAPTLAALAGRSGPPVTAPAGGCIAMSPAHRW